MSNLKKILLALFDMERRKVFIILFLIFIFGYFLRVMFLPKNILTFGYDQARDAVNALEIAHGHLKIFGPPASQPGLFHGTLWYYVLAPFYLIGNGSPIVAAYGIAFVNMLTSLIVFCLAYLMTKSKKTALASAFLFAISFEASQYATWLSNPTLGIITVPLMYLGLWMWIDNSLTSKKTIKQLAPVVVAIGLGLSIQSEIFLAYHIVPLIIWLYVARKNVTKKQLIIFGGVLLLTLSTMFLAQLKFGILPTINAVKNLAAGEGGNLAYEKSIGDYGVLYLNQIGRVFSFNSYPQNVGWGFLFVTALVVLGCVRKDKRILFLSTWMFSHLSVVSVGGTSTPFLMVGIGPAISILMGIYIGDWIKKKYFILAFGVFLVLIYGNISTILSQNRNGATLFSIQKDMVLSKELSVVDYTYEKSDGKNFSINTLTSPLWVNIVWSYLYKWYGQENYGYVPTWHGRGQEGQVISLDSDSNNWKLGFLVIEPQDGIPSQFLPQLIDQENSYSKLIIEQYFGAIRVQERLR